MGACASDQNQKDTDTPDTDKPVDAEAEAETRNPEWKKVESGIGPRALGLAPRKDKVLHGDVSEVMSYDATEVEEERNAKRQNRRPGPTAFRGSNQPGSGSEDDDISDGTEELGNVVYKNTCMVENYLSSWLIEIIHDTKENKLRIHLESETEVHKTFPTLILLDDVIDCTIDQTKITIRFNKARLHKGIYLVVFFNTIECAADFIQHIPSHLTCRLLFSEVAIYCKRQRKALVQLVTYGKQKRFVRKRHGAALLIKTEKEEITHPIHSSTECSSQVRLVAVDEHSKDPRLLQFVTVGMAQTFIRKFSEIIHDLYGINHILLYSGIVIHQKKTKRLELRQFDNGTTVLSIFLRKEPTVSFNELPTYSRNGLELRLTSLSQDNLDVSVYFRTDGEVTNFTAYLQPGLE